MLKEVKKDIRALANPSKAKLLQGFFKTGKGEYGEGDVFLGLMVPQSRSIALKYKGLAPDDIEALLQSTYHEERLIALLILVHNYKKGTGKQRKQIYNFYIKHLKYINNWDLVDLSAPNIVGAYLADKDKKILIKLAKADHLWSKRVAMLSTFYFIRFQKSTEWAFRIAEILLNDKHDLIHKAVGWMLREAGKNISRQDEEVFLQKHYRRMPRTMLRYAIEHFPPQLRAIYMKKEMN